MTDRPMSFTLLIAENKFSASVAISAHGGWLELNSENIVKEIKRNGIVFGINRQAIKELLINPKSNSTVIIAEGILPVKGTDAEEYFFIDIENNFKQSTDNKINYRDAFDLPIVETGDNICKYKNHIDGIIGKDIFGSEYHPKEIKKLSFELGDNVETINNCLCKSTCKGIVTISTDGKLSVSPVLKIDGDVDMSVGNINYHDNVFISGNLLSGFTINAGGDVIINGNVEDAKITAKGNIKIAGGINGKGKGTIKAGGFVTCKYANQINIESFGNIEILSETKQSTLKTTKWLNIETGSILGGEIIALNGVKVSSVGSNLGVNTKIFLGVNFRIKDIKIELQRLSSDFIGFANDLKPYIKDPTLFENSNLNDKEELSVKHEVYKAKVKEWKILSTELETLELEFEKVDGIVLLHGTLHEDTSVRSPICGKLFTESINGPVTIKEDLANFTMKVDI